ncbi:pilus motility taxis protein HmpF [Leptolyngbya sp. CCNP1308]|uniref:pilus motility taxis protein HmpF n=1 Tax=Leptolyngbya sp. CCNP1308 TaxID=3110255 RepID=UPI002B213B78|nr:pilus motility taxis protein HmpF [Leptolyngbya sp. CCNP1308]MEA5449772.1 pilus motility taxis protein HmpF [Leptolyngbya sp. CCNP1308]
MLYLAEVQKKTGFIGSGKPEFKLLACQRSENSWSAVTGDETLVAPDDASYNAGALVMVDVSGNRQVQRHYEAGRSLTTILQNFSNLSKKSKTQEEEIEQWKQSLTFQSQELNRRELELESRQEQVEQAEADLEQLDAQRQELDQLRQSLEQQQEELTRKNQDLEGAWAHLNGEMRRLEEQRAEGVTTAGLDAEQVANLQGALNRLTEAVMPVEALRDPLTHATDGLNYHQGLLGDYRQALEGQRQGLEQRQQELDQQATQLSQRWADWRQAEAALVAKREDLKLRQQAVKTQQEQIQTLTDTLQAQANLHQKIYDLLNTTDKVRLSKKVDVAALEAMDLDHLQTMVGDLEKDLEKMSRFVSDQEEELALEQQAIDEIQLKIEQASEFDRLQLETEIEEEQDRYQMLNETLVGQRRNLLEREELLSQHQAVLRRRQGLTVEETPVSAVDLEPLLNTIDAQRQQTTDSIQALETEVKKTQDAIGQLKREIEGAEAALTTHRAEVEAFEAGLRQQQQDLAGLMGKLAVCEELLNPAQESVNGLRQSLENLAGAVTKLQEVNDYQLQAIAELRQTVVSVGAPPVTAS